MLFDSYLKSSLKKKKLNNDRNIKINLLDIVEFWNDFLIESIKYPKNYFLFVICNNKNEPTQLVNTSLKTEKFKKNFSYTTTFKCINRHMSNNKSIFYSKKALDIDKLKRTELLDEDNDIDISSDDDLDELFSKKSKKGKKTGKRSKDNNNNTQIREKSKKTKLSDDDDDDIDTTNFVKTNNKFSNRKKDKICIDSDDSDDLIMYSDDEISEIKISRNNKRLNSDLLPEIALAQQSLQCV